MANSIFDWALLRAIFASRLIAVDKCPGIKPIGVGEVRCRVICKSVCLVTCEDAEAVCSSAQLCAGMRCGVEGAIHTVFDIFNSNDHEVLIRNAQNAFNFINRTAVIWNIRVLWPRASRFIFNTYRVWSPLVVRGSDTMIYSCKGVVQGDPLSMFAYAVATIPLIRKLEDPYCRLRYGLLMTHRLLDKQVLLGGQIVVRWSIVWILP